MTRGVSKSLSARRMLASNGWRITGRGIYIRNRNRLELKSAEGRDAKEGVTEARRRVILEAIAAGGSTREATRRAGVNESTIRLWLRRGKTASPESRYREFAQAFALAEQLAQQREAARLWRRMAALEDGPGPRLVALTGPEEHDQP